MQLNYIALENENLLYGFGSLEPIRGHWAGSPGNQPGMKIAGLQTEINAFLISVIQLSGQCCDVGVCGGAMCVSTDLGGFCSSIFSELLVEEQ